jgi:hypothetical protein
MSTAGGTQRGTPKNARPQMSFTEGGPSSIPRPKLESMVSDANTSLSASRAKQSKRDDVGNTLVVHARC